LEAEEKQDSVDNGSVETKEKSLNGSGRSQDYDVAERLRLGLPDITVLSCGRYVHVSSYKTRTPTSR